MAYRRGMGLTPGYTAAQQAMADSFASSYYPPAPGPTSVYDVPGLLLAAPDCTQANGGAYVSSACVDQALATQQQNFARTAAYNAGTLILPAGTPPPTPPPPPPTNPVCTQPNYYDKNGNCVAPVAAPTPAPPAPVIPPNTDSGGGTVTANYVTQGTDFLTGDTTIAGFTFPTWGLLAAGAAALYFLTGKH